MIEPDRRPHPGWRVRALSVVVFVAAVVTFLAVTKGPVYRLRVERGPLSGDFLDDGWTQRVFCVVYLVAIAAALPLIRWTRRLAWIALVMSSPAAVLVATSMWSPHTDRALEQSLMMLLGTGAAIAIGAALSPLRMLWAMWASMVVGLGLSVVAGRLDWVFSKDVNGGLVGVYFNKNSFGAVAAMAGLASLGLIGVALDAPAGDRRRVVALMCGSAGALVSAVFVLRAASLTPMVGMVVAIGVSMVVVVASGRTNIDDAAGDRPDQRRGPWMPFALVVALISVAGAAVIIGVRRAGQISTVADRIEIWDAVVGFISRRPILGWGLMSVWLEDEMSARIQLDGGRVIHEAHNGYLEVALGGGIVALGALIVAIGCALTITFQTWTTRRENACLWLFAAVVYGVVVNFGESYAGANLLPWMVIVAATMSAASVSTEARSAVTASLSTA